MTANDVDPALAGENEIATEEPTMGTADMDRLCNTLTHLLTATYASVGGKPATVTDALFAISASLDAIAQSLDDLAGEVDRLGLANAATPQGAIEVLSSEIKDGFMLLSSAIQDRP